MHDCKLPFVTLWRIFRITNRKGTGERGRRSPVFYVRRFALRGGDMGVRRSGIMLPRAGGFLCRKGCVPSVMTGKKGASRDALRSFAYCGKFRRFLCVAALTERDVGVIMYRGRDGEYNKIGNLIKDRGKRKTWKENLPKSALSVRARSGPPSRFPSPRSVSSRRSSLSTSMRRRRKARQWTSATASSRWAR